MPQVLAKRVIIETDPVDGWRTYIFRWRCTQDHYWPVLFIEDWRILQHLSDVHGFHTLLISRDKDVIQNISGQIRLVPGPFPRYNPDKWEKIGKDGLR